MKNLLITTFTLIVLSASSAIAQSVYISNSNVLYQYDQNLQRVEIDSYDEEVMLTVDASNNIVTLKSGKGLQSFTIITTEEFQLESGMLYKYDVATDDGEVRKLEINTQKKIITIKPKEIKSGETSRKYILN